MRNSISTMSLVLFVLVSFNCSASVDQVCKSAWMVKKYKACEDKQVILEPVNFDMDCKTGSNTELAERGCIPVYNIKDVEKSNTCVLDSVSSGWVSGDSAKPQIQKEVVRERVKNLKSCGLTKEMVDSNMYSITAEEIPGSEKVERVIGTTKYQYFFKVSVTTRSIVPEQKPEHGISHFIAPPKYKVSRRLECGVEDEYFVVDDKMLYDERGVISLETVNAGNAVLPGIEGVVMSSESKEDMPICLSCDHIDNQSFIEKTGCILKNMNKLSEVLAFEASEELGPVASIEVLYLLSKASRTPLLSILGAMQAELELFNNDEFIAMKKLNLTEQEHLILRWLEEYQAPVQ